MTAGVAPVDRPEDLTPAWVTAALRQGGHEVTVSAVATEPIGHGQVGANYRLRLQGDGPLPGTLVAKMGAGEDRSMVANGYRNEVTFYLDLAPTVAVATPRCWFGAMTDDATVFTLLLEDLAPAEPGDQVAGCSPDEAEAAAVNLAGLHGPRWCDPTLYEHPELNAVDDDGAAFLGAVFASAVAIFVERYRAEIDDDGERVLQRFAEAVPTWITARSERFALGHGDYRLDNLLFDPTGGVHAVDWQTLSVGQPGRDLAYFCGTSLEVEVRRVHEEAVVTAYRGALLGHGVDGTAYSAATAFEDYRLGVLQGPLITVLGVAYATAGRSERADAMFLTMFRRSLAAIEDLQPFALL